MQTYFKVDTKATETEKAMMEGPFKILLRTWFFMLIFPFCWPLLCRKRVFSANCSLCELLWNFTYQNTFQTNKWYLISSRSYCHLKDTNMCEWDYKLSTLFFNFSLFAFEDSETPCSPLKKMKEHPKYKQWTFKNLLGWDKYKLNSAKL